MPYDVSVLRGSSDLVLTCVSSDLISLPCSACKQTCTSLGQTDTLYFLHKEISCLCTSNRTCNSDIAHVSTNSVYECAQCLYISGKICILHTYMNIALVYANSFIYC